MKVGIVEFAVYFTGLDLAKGDLFFDVVDDHQEMFAFLGMGTVLVITALLSSITMAGRVMGRRSSWLRAVM
jgi:hypothetical protein